MPGQVFFLQPIKKLLQSLFQSLGLRRRCQRKGLGERANSGIWCELRLNVGSGLVRGEALLPIAAVGHAWPRGAAAVPCSEASARQWRASRTSAVAGRTCDHRRQSMAWEWVVGQVPVVAVPRYARLLAAEHRPRWRQHCVLGPGCHLGRVSGESSVAGRPTDRRGRLRDWRNGGRLISAILGRQANRRGMPRSHRSPERLLQMRCLFPSSLGAARGARASDCDFASSAERFSDGGALF